jgi:hypothetical protein
MRFWIMQELSFTKGNTNMTYKENETCLKQAIEKLRNGGDIRREEAIINAVGKDYAGKRDRMNMIKIMVNAGQDVKPPAFLELT